MHRRFEERASLQPNALAIKEGPLEYSYGFMNNAANHIATEIMGCLGENPAQVGIMGTEAAVELVSVLAIWKAGKTAVFLNEEASAVGVETIIKDADIDVVVCENSTRARVMELGCHAVSAHPDSGSAENPHVSVDPDGPALLLYTSGSTGEPKGVIRSHTVLLHGFSCNTCFLGIGSDDRLSLMHTLAFAPGVSGSLAALLNGVPLLPFNLRRLGLIPLPRWMAEERPTVLSPPMAVFRQFSNLGLGREETSSCRCVLLGGERMYQSDIETFRSLFGPECQLVYQYGCTEAGGVSSLRVDEGISITDDPVPIGYPSPGIEVRILDQDGDEVERGGVGEIAVVGDHLALGYWRKPELTEQKFKVFAEEMKQRRMYKTGDMGHIDEKGLIFYHGRVDGQIKASGHRIELGAVEHALNDLPDVVQAVVLASSNSRKETVMTAYVQFSRLGKFSISELRKKIASKLPNYMVPDRIITVDEMPLNANRKIDRRALASMEGEYEA